MANEYSFEGPQGSFLTRAKRVSSQTAATLAVTESKYDDRTIKLDRAAGGITATLPAARGTGARFRFVIGTKLSSGSYIVKTASASDYMRGQAWMCNDSDNTVSGFETANTDTPSTESDTITFDGSTTGGRVGDVIECEDIALHIWAVQVHVTGSGSEASPWSAAV